MGFREVGVIEVKEVLRAWLEGAGTRTAAERAGVDRKTARRYVEAAQAAGLVRSAGFDAVDDVLVGQVVAAVRPARPNGHGQAWEQLLGREQQICDWVAGKGVERPLTIVGCPTFSGLGCWTFQAAIGAMWSPRRISLGVLYPSVE